MGPMVCSDEIAGDFARTSILSLWAHNCHGFIWWCANDQNHLTQAPYDWMSCERELGLLRQSGEAKPVLKEMAKVKRIIKEMPFEKLSQRDINAVCITKTNQDHWAVAYSTFILSKQGGFDIEFIHEDQQLKDSQLYLIPCIKGVGGISKHRWVEILKKVSPVATLYISVEDGYIADFEEVTGLKVETRYKSSGDIVACIKGTLDGVYEEINMEFSSPIKFEFINKRAMVLGAEKDGNTVFTSSAYGKGKVFLCQFLLK